MKKIIILILGLSLISIVAIGADSYKYEKKDAITLKTSKTITNVVNSEKTIAQLKNDKARLTLRKTQVTTNYESDIASLDTEIAVIDTQLAEAIKLGIADLSSE